MRKLAYIFCVVVFFSGCAGTLIDLKSPMTEISSHHETKVALYFESFNFTVGSRVVSNIYKAKTRETKNYIRDSKVLVIVDMSGEGYPVENLDELTSECPNIISQKVSIGQSLEGREIWMVRLSDNPNIEEDEPEVLYTGLHHAREPMSYMNLFFYMNYLCENYDSDVEIRNIIDNRELYFVPVVNPDGLVYNESIAPDGGGLQRKNGLESCADNNNDNLWDGVDLNRNYGYYWGYDDEGSSPDGCSQTYRGSGPFSEPETYAIKNFVEQHDFKIALNYHSYSNLLIYPFGYSYENDVPQEDLDIFKSLKKLDGCDLSLAS